MEVQEFNVFSIDFFQNINSYKQNLTISQIIKFFERFEIVLPKTTIQNLVRNNVISEVVDKRYYTKIHILQIIIFYLYKECFTLNDIKKINNEVTLQCNDRDIDIVFYEILNVNNNIDDYSMDGGYLDIIYLMSSSVRFKNKALLKLNKL